MIGGRSGALVPKALADFSVCWGRFAVLTALLKETPDRFLRFCERGDHAIQAYSIAVRIQMQYEFCKKRLAQSHVERRKRSAVQSAALWRVTPGPRKWIKGTRSRVLGDVPRTGPLASSSLAGPSAGSRHWRLKLVMGSVMS